MGEPSALVASRLDSVTSARFSIKTGGRNKAAIGAFEESGESDAALVAILRADDLHTDRQPLCREPGRCNSRRQIEESGQPGPEKVVNRRGRLAVDLDHALPALALVIVIVGVRRTRRDRAQQQIVIRKN